jgi:hypothetical protein
VLFISFHLQRTPWAGERLRFNPSPYVLLFLSSTYTPRAHCFTRAPSRFSPSSSIVVDERRCWTDDSPRPLRSRRVPQAPVSLSLVHVLTLSSPLAHIARAQQVGDFPQGAFVHPICILRLFLYLIIALGNFLFSIFIIFVARTCGLLEHPLCGVSLLDGHYDDADGLLDSLDALDAGWIARSAAHAHRFVM